MATTTLGTLVLRLKADTTQFSTAFNRAQSQLSGISTAARGAGIAMGAAFAGGALLIGKSISLFAKFEKEMAAVGAISGAVGGQFEELTARARTLAQQTEFTATETAAAMRFLAQAGFEVNEIMEATGPVMRLASVGMLDVARAADITTNIMAGMGKGVEDLNEVNSILIATSTTANTNVEQLGQAFKFVGPVAASAGVSMAELSATMGMLGNAGIQAEMAGTSTRNAIARLLDPTSKAADLIQRLGLNVTDSSGKFVGFVQIIRQLEASGADTAEVMALFGKRSGPAMLALLSQGSGVLNEYAAQIEAAGKAGTITDDIYAKLSKTFAFQSKILTSKTEEAGIAIGEALAPALMIVNAALQVVVDSFNELSPTMKSTIAIGAVVVTGLLGIGAALAAIVAVIPFVVAGFSAIGITSLAALGPILAWPVAIGAGIVAFIVLRSAMKRAIDAMTVDLGLFGVVVTTIFDAIQLSIDALMAPITLLRLGFKALADIGGKAPPEAEGPEAPSTITEKLKEKLKELGDKAKKVVNEFIDLDGVTKDVELRMKRAVFQTDEFKTKMKKVNAELDETLKSAIPNLDELDQALVDAGQATGAFAAAVDASGTAIAETGLRKMELKPAEEAAEKIATAGEQIGDAAFDVAQQTGALGQVMAGAARGFEAGGPIGAVIGAIVALLLQLESIMTVIDQVNEGFGFLLKALSPLFDGIVKVNEVINQALAPIMESLGRIFTVLGDILFQLASPVMELIKIAGGILGPIFDLVATVFEMLGAFVKLLGAFDLMTPLFEAMAPVIEFFGDVVGEVAQVFEDIAREIQKVANTIGSFIDQLFGGGGGLAPRQMAAGAGVGGVSRAVDSIELSADAAAIAALEAGTALEDLADTVRDVNEQLTNVPQGFKVALARFQATEVGTDVPALGGGLGGNVINIESSDPNHTWNQLNEIEGFNSMASQGTVNQGGEFGTDRNGS